MWQVRHSPTIIRTFNIYCCAVPIFDSIVYPTSITPLPLYLPLFQVLYVSCLHYDLELFVFRKVTLNWPRLQGEVYVTYTAVRSPSLQLPGHGSDMYDTCGTGQQTVMNVFDVYGELAITTSTYLHHLYIVLTYISEATYLCYYK